MKKFISILYFLLLSTAVFSQSVNINQQSIIRPNRGNYITVIQNGQAKRVSEGEFRDTLKFDFEDKFYPSVVTNVQPINNASTLRGYYVKGTQDSIYKIDSKGKSLFIGFNGRQNKTAFTYAALSTSAAIGESLQLPTGEAITKVSTKKWLSNKVMGTSTPALYTLVSGDTISNEGATWKNPNISVVSGQTVDFVLKNGIWRPVKDFLSIEDFGGKADDEIDDTPAANKSITYQRYIKFSKGKYYMNLTINVDSVEINSDGQNQTYIFGMPNVVKNVIEVNYCYLGNSAPKRRNVTIRNVTINGNRLNNATPVDDLTGWGLAITNCDNFKCDNVNVRNCFYGFGLFITSEFAQVRASVDSCGYVVNTPYPTGAIGFDINSCNNGYFEVIANKCKIGARMLDNCTNNTMNVKCSETAFTGFIYGNQSVNKSFNNTINVEINQGCSTNGVNIGNNIKSSKVTAKVMGVLGYAINVSGDTSTAYNDFDFNTTDCRNLSTIFSASKNKVKIRSKNGGLSQGVGGVFDIVVNGQDNDIDYIIDANPSNLVRGGQFSATATGNTIRKIEIGVVQKMATANNKNRSTVFSAVDTLTATTTLNLFDDVNLYHITGTSGIQFFQFGIPNRIYTFYFTGVSTLIHSAGNLKLLDGQNYTTKAGESITLICESFNVFREIGRSTVTLRGSASVNITSLVAGTPQTQNFTITGAIAGQKVLFFDTGGTVLSSTVTVSKAYVSASNTVTLEFSRSSGTTANVTGTLQLEVK